ncbi:gliding motility-associated C-terminal domain-containing protein [Ekhidna lutea]|uniref:Gliding motility-associated C-terminal domain-containing protein n=1 Tax=Ekhidna lutea TaxID=447679 RepID=A0A239HDX7_EKHLU|nr:PKD domain-containing protein [Ekhidna lutea]SNS78464.1 gliding motility-associated C-terminal domain-containing protein [Ekhidna lutea]
MRLNLSLTTALILSGILAFGQCNLLSTDISKDFSASGVCAPVDVNTFRVVYTFNVAQNPSDIQIEFRWNDPGNTIETLSTTTANSINVSGGNRIYEAFATPFMYPDSGDECFYEAQAFIIVAGDVCETSEENQLIPSWNIDTENGGEIAFDPGQYDICENTPLTNVVFDDASTFNCNIIDNPDNPNQISRWTQFVYGTDGAPAVGRIRDLTVNDGGTVVVTDNAGNLSSPQTRGTGAVTVTAGHFGPVEEVPFPANGPIHSTFPISAPANPANVIGTTFEVTLYNWNTCNPFNGDQTDPNYEDAVSETVLIEVIPPPEPDYIARQGGPGGATPAEFCINSDIYFDNETPGGSYTFQWEFYNGPSDTDPLLGTSNATNPTFSFGSGGQKLVRLIATNPNADGVCDVIYDDLVTLSPAAVADFAFYDAGFTTTINPDFCQTGSDVFTVGFRDNTVDQANTEFRYEFFDEGNNLIGTEPADGSYLPDPVPDFTRTFSTEEYTIVRLEARNTSTLCGSFSEDTVFVYGVPQPEFTSNEVCAGNRSSFSGIADPSSLTVQVNNDVVNLYEWDFSYDGSFNVELSRTDSTQFDWYLDGTDIANGVEPGTSVAGTYTVALRMTTEKGNCSTVVTGDVVVHPNPDAQVSHDASSDICPGEEITFTNGSNNPSIPTSYTIEITHSPSGFLLSSSLVSPDTTLTFDNPDDTTRTFQVQLIAESDEGCITSSNYEPFRVSPDEDAGFTDPSYDFFNTNCSPWNSTMVVDQETQDLFADSYRWTLLDDTGIMSGYPVIKNSSEANFNQLDYQIINTSSAIMNYRMVLEAEKSGVCITNDTFNIQISPQPDASFVVNRSEDCDEVNLILEASQKGLSNYDWSFNPAPDITTGTGDEIMVTYFREVNSGNDFNAEITLTTTNLASCNSDPVTEIELIEKQPPATTADFTLSTNDLQLPDNTVTITNNSSTGAGYSYQWDFGDGTSFSGYDPGTHEYNQYGSYDIILYVSNSGCTVQTSQTLTVHPADPIVDFEADILEGCAPLTVQFTNLSQYTEPGEYVWEFGDGNISRSDNPTHTYFESGSFTVRLRGQNEVGTVAETVKDDYIQVYAQPFADFLVSARVVYIPDQEAVFKNLSENATSFQWSFGDGTTSTESEPRHAYSEEGFYDITLIATNEFGCSDTLYRAAEVQAIAGGQIKTPNAFTPSLNGPSGGYIGSEGGDPSQINDIFLPRIEGVERFRMLIYNKWGELIFESNSKDIGWDGYYQGKLAPSGVYVYKLEIRYSDGSDFTTVGDVTLIR